jgi:hypothetical protein
MKLKNLLKEADQKDKQRKKMGVAFANDIRRVISKYMAEAKKIDGPNAPENAEAMMTLKKLIQMLPELTAQWFK